MLGIYQTETVTLLRHGGLTPYGEPNAYTGSTVKGRVIFGERRVFVEEGEEKVATGRVLLSEAPSLRDKLVIDGVTYIILAVRKHSSFTALGYYEVLFQ